jgi:seryl-tRNA synthetase
MTPQSSSSGLTECQLENLLEHGLLISSGVPGVYGLSGTFESVVERFEAYLSRVSEPSGAEVMRFPPLLSRRSYRATDHLDMFPNLMGSVHTFLGDVAGAAELTRKNQADEDWSADLAPTDVMLTPAACYPLYPTATGVLPDDGRTVDLRAFVFRHEPSSDPARMQIFRQREFVRLGSPVQALAHRDGWLDRGRTLLCALGLDPQAVVANDPFFGDGRRLMAATQREQTLKYELVAPTSSSERPTAIASCNCHLDHFGRAFDITTRDGEFAHSACIGFGLERIALALFAAHGLRPASWPASVRGVLGL